MRKGKYFCLQFSLAETEECLSNAGIPYATFFYKHSYFVLPLVIKHHQAKQLKVVFECIMEQDWTRNQSINEISQKRFCWTLLVQRLKKEYD